jgi:hypothetical protein
MARTWRSDLGRDLGRDPTSATGNHPMGAIGKYQVRGTSCSPVRSIGKDPTNHSKPRGVM